MTVTGCDDLATGAEVNRKQNGAAVAWVFAEAGVDQLSEEAKSFTEIEWAKRHAAKEDKKQMLADRLGKSANPESPKTDEVRASGY